MTAWIVICALGLVSVTLTLRRSRRVSRKPFFVSWVKVDAPCTESAPRNRTASDRRPDQEQVVGWTELDDRQLARLLSQESP